MKMERQIMTTLKEAIDGVFAVDPAANAVECNGQWWSWGALSQVRHTLLAQLEHAALGPGARIGCMLPNHPASIGVLAAVMASERCVVTLNAGLPDQKLAADIASLQLAVVVGSARDWERPAIRAAAKGAGVLALVLPETAGGAIQADPKLNTVRASVVRDAPGIAIEMLTSGTTGTPKRIPLPLKRFEKMLNDAALYERDRMADSRPQLRKGINFVMVPFAHMGGVWSVMNTLVSGRQVFLMERFALPAFVDAMRRHRPRSLATPPAMLRMVLDSAVAKEDLASLSVWRTSTAPLDPAVADRFYDTYGIPALQVYGATEFAGGVAGWTLADFKEFGNAKRGSVGRINPGIEGRVIEPESGRVLATGAEGVLSLRAGHLGNGTDWLDTTDRAVIDADGFIFIRGRNDNAISRGGFKIMPDDVVKALEQHPAVLEAAVCGIADERVGEVPVAGYLLQAGAADPGMEALQTFLRASLSPYQIPVRLVALAELPRTPSMKVSLVELRELLLSHHQGVSQ